MKMRKFVGLCAALAFGMGSTAVHALKFTQAASDDPATTATAATSVTYAKETLEKESGDMTAAKDETDKTKYYNIVRDHFVSAPPGVTGSATDVYVLSYTLEGMVFQEAVPDLTGFSKAAGGAAGDKEVVFRATAAVDGTFIALTAKFAVSEEGGSITMEARNNNLVTILGPERGMKTHGPATIMVKPALKETVMPAEPAPTAKAASGFMNFGGSAAAPMLRASLGTFEVGVVAPALEHAQGADNAAEDITTLDDITVVTANTDGSVANSVTFGGDFSFLKTLALVDNAETGAQCTGALTELRKPVTPATTPATYTGETMPKEAQTFELDTDADDTADNMLQHLCVEVDGEMEIPMTGAYTVMAKYKGLANAAFPPMGMERELAMIKRDGASFRIPFLTTNTDLYKQLVIVVNHGAAAEYSFGSFHAAGDATASAGSMASGTLPMGQTVLKSTDIVMVEGGNRAAATLSIVADASNFSVAVQQIRAGTGQSDMVYLDPM